MHQILRVAQLLVAKIEELSLSEQNLQFIAFLSKPIIQVVVFLELLELRGIGLLPSLPGHGLVLFLSFLILFSVTIGLFLLFFTIISLSSDSETVPELLGIMPHGYVCGQILFDTSNLTTFGYGLARLVRILTWIDRVVVSIHLSVQDRAEVAAIVIFTSVYFFSESIDLLKQLIGRDDLFLQHHVTTFAVDRDDLKVLNMLRNVVHQVSNLTLHF